MKQYVCTLCQAILTDATFPEHGNAHHRENEAFFTVTGQHLFNGPVILKDYEDTTQGFIDRTAKKMFLAFQNKLHPLPHGWHWGFKSEFEHDSDNRVISWKMNAVPSRTWTGEDE